MQDLSACDGIAAAKHPEVSKTDLGVHGIRRNFAQTLKASCSGRPATHEEGIVCGKKSVLEAAGIKGLGSFEAAYRFVQRPCRR